MSTEDHNANTLHIHLKQYEQCWQDKRALEAMIWQTPAVFLAIVGVLLAGLMSRGFPSINVDGINRFVMLATYLVTLLFALAVSVVGTVQLRKHRLFAVAREHDLRWIERYLQTRGEVYFVQFRTMNAIRDFQRYPDIKKSWIDRQSAYDWLFTLSCIVTVLLTAAIIILPILAYFNLI